MKLLKQVVADLDWVLVIIAAVIVSALQILGEISITMVTSTTLLVLGVLAFSALRDRYASRRLRNTVDQLRASNVTALYSEGLLSDRMRTGIERVIARTVDFDWLPEILNARNVTIAKLKLNFTENTSYYRAFEGVLDKDGSVTIVMADPRSPAMWLRYMEEPSGASVETQSFETVWVKGLEELAAELSRLNAWRERLLQEGRDVKRLSIRVCAHYPTHAFYRFDNRLYVYHYPYLERGYEAPAFLFTNPNTDTHKFLSRCIASVVGSSLPLENEIDDIQQKYRDGLLSDERVRESRITIAGKTG